MKRVRFKEQNIIGVLREAAPGVRTLNRIRKHDVSDPTLYN